MPITQAAKEPDFGLAPLKKRCRESNPRLAPLKKRCREPNLGPAPLKKRCRQPEVDGPPRNHACGIADGADGGKPYSWRTKDLVRPVPASDFDWKREKYHFPLIKAEGYLKSVPPLPRPHHLKSWKGPVPLWRVKFLHLHPSLKHIALREDNTRCGNWLWIRGYDFEESRRVYMLGE